MAFENMKKQYYWNVVLALIGINVLMFILQQFIPGMTEALLLDSSKLWSEPWRLITSMFLHADIWHILFNMYALFIFGILIEQRIGSKRFLFAYFLFGIVAGIGASFFYPKALGASGPNSKQRKRTRMRSRKSVAR